MFLKIIVHFSIFIYHVSTNFKISRIW